VRLDLGPRPSAAERVTLALCFLVIGALLAVVVYAGTRQEASESGSIEMTFDMEHVEFRDGAHFIPYTIRNTGREAVSSAEIRFDVFDGDRVVDSAEITVQFLPVRGSQTGVYVTSLDPATHTVEGRLESLQFP
jgi:uncharacterized protein (TIGR02588 family)